MCLGVIVQKQLLFTHSPTLLRAPASTLSLSQTSSDIRFGDSNFGLVAYWGRSIQSAVLCSENMRFQSEMSCIWAVLVAQFLTSQMSLCISVSLILFQVITPSGVLPMMQLYCSECLMTVIIFVAQLFFIVRVKWQWCAVHIVFFKPLLL